MKPLLQCKGECSRAVAALALAYGLGAWGSLQLAAATTHAPLIWLPAGIALGALLLYGGRLWPGIVLGALIAAIVAGHPLLASLISALGSAGGALVAYWLIHRLAPSFDIRLTRLSEYLLLIGPVAALASLTAAGAESLAVLMAGPVEAGSMRAALTAWWLADMLGILFGTPLMLLWLGKQPFQRRIRAWELLAFMAVACALCGILYFDWWESFKPFKRGYLVLPLLVWAAFAFGRRGTLLATFGFFAAAVGGAYAEVGYFARYIASQDHFALWLYGFTLALTGMVTTLLLHDRDRIAAELDLRRDEALARERLLNAIFDTAKVGILVTDTAGRITHANAHVQTLFGLSADQIIGDEYVKLLPERERAIASWRVRQLVAGEIPSVDIDRLYLRADGSEFWGHLNSGQITDNDGRLIGLIGVIADIDERQRAIDELRIAARVFEASNEGILIADAANRILSVNRAFTEITGYSQQEAIGHTPALLSSGRHSREFYKALWATLTQHGRWQGEIWNRRKDGREYPEWLSIVQLRDDAGAVVNHIGIFSDITERKAAETRMERLAQYDSLTNLPNRNLLYDRLATTLTAARRYGRGFALLFVDLDGFKPINDTYGHDIGDAVLREVAQRLRGNMREADTVSRHGGDEFVILSPEINGAEGAGTLADKIVATLARPIVINALSLQVTASVGIALYPDHGNDIDTLIRVADAAMYRAKTAGRNTWRLGERETG